MLDSLIERSFERKESGTDAPFKALAGAGSLSPLLEQGRESLC